MKFRIDSSGFFLREENRGSVTVMNLETNQVVYINATGRRVFDRCDETVDFDEFIDGLDYPSVSREKLCGDYKKLLIKLYANGFAALTGIERRTEDGCFIAAPEDIDALSSFLRAACSNANSCAAAVSPVYYSRYAVYSRILNGQTPYLYLQRGSRIIAAADAQAAALGLGESVVSLGSFFFDEKLSGDECGNAVKELTELAAAAARQSASKLRYMYMNPRQDKIVQTLVQIGFRNTAVLEKEVNGRDLCLYDLFI